MSVEWYDAKAEIVGKHAGRNWHRIRDVRGEEMRGTCSLCGDVPVRWNQSGGYFVCAGQARKDRHAAVERRRRRLAEYGLMDGEYEQMEAAQGGKCVICKDEPAAGDKLVIDHDHSTGAVRDLLCRSCNTGLGAFRDKPELMLEAIEYLRRHSSRPLVLFGARHVQ